MSSNKRLTKAELAERADDALDRWRGGVPLSNIVERFGFRNAAQAEAAMREAIARQGGTMDPAGVRELELDRLDRLHQRWWPAALRGDEKATDRVLRISEQRVRLSGVPAEPIMVAAFEETAAGLATENIDSALVAAGRRIAMSIDAAAATGDRTAEAKALYLVPHLLSVLRELGATPTARGAVREAADELGSEAKVSALDAWRAKQSTS